jgi:UDP-glucose 4-epimerase
MTRVLITGVAGLLGSRLATWILDNVSDVTVYGLDDLTGGYESNVDPRVQFLLSDVSRTDFESIKGLENGVDYVYHFAAYAAEGLSPFIRKFNYINNLVATANVINYCIRTNVKRLVFTSSMAVYGDAMPPFHESMRPNPIDPYGIAKFACEMDIRVAGEQHGLDWCIIRPHNVYGRNQNIWDAYRNVLGIWMFRHLNGQPLVIFGDGSQSRAFSYIDDSLKPLWIAAADIRCSREIINLGGTTETRLLDAASELINVMGSGSIEYAPVRHEVKHAFSTWQKSVELLGFEHKTSLCDGLKDMWSWAQQQPARERFVWDKYEVDKGLYPFWKQESLRFQSK